MPIYEFSCRKCGHGFEELLTASQVEQGDVECPACGSRRVEKGFSSFATGGPSSAGGGACAGGGGFT